MKETCWKLQGKPPQVHMMSQPYPNQGEMPGNQQWTQNYMPSSNPSGAQPPTNSSTPMNSHQTRDMRNLQQQIQSIQQKIQNLQASSVAPTSARSVIGSTSIANSSKQPILLALSSASSFKSYQSS